MTSKTGEFGERERDVEITDRCKIKFCRPELSQSFHVHQMTETRRPTAEPLDKAKYIWTFVALLRPMPRPNAWRGPVFPHHTVASQAKFKMLLEQHQNFSCIGGALRP